MEHEAVMNLCKFAPKIFTVIGQELDRNLRKYPQGENTQSYIHKLSLYKEFPDPIRQPVFSNGYLTRSMFMDNAYISAKRVFESANYVYYFNALITPEPKIRTFSFSCRGTQDVIHTVLLPHDPTNKFEMDKIAGIPMSLKVEKIHSPAGALVIHTDKGDVALFPLGFQKLVESFVWAGWSGPDGPNSRQRKPLLRSQSSLVPQFNI
jgi:hypothetical protein